MQMLHVMVIYCMCKMYLSSLCQENDNSRYRTPTVRVKAMKQLKYDFIDVCGRE